MELTDTSKVHKTRSRSRSRSQSRPVSAYSDYSEPLITIDHQRHMKDGHCQTDKQTWHAVQIDVVKKIVAEVVPQTVTVDKITQEVNWHLLEQRDIVLKVINKNYVSLASQTYCCFTFMWGLCIIIMALLVALVHWLTVAKVIDSPF